MRNSKIKRILSIDGGGIKGVFPAVFLEQLEEELQQPLHNYFDLIAGTSTGGIIAIGIALGISAKEISDFYQKEGSKIFSQSHDLIGKFIPSCIDGLFFAPKYSPKPLEKVLNSTLKNKKIGNAKTRLLVPTWGSGMGNVYIYKTAHHQRLYTDYKAAAVDAALATAAAPTYFAEHLTSDGVRLIDGGVWANNPTGIAVAEAIGTLGWEANNLRVLSLGCLEEITTLKKQYGKFSIANKIVDILMSGQSAGSNGISRILTGDVGGTDIKKIYRVSPYVENGYFKLDDTSKICELKGMAVECARREYPNLKEVFFKNNVEVFQPFHNL